MIWVVVDTNLFIAGRWNPKSHSNRILDLCIEGRLKPVTTPEIKDENFYILSKVNPPKDYLDKIFKFYQKSLRVRPKKRIGDCEDPSDNRFLEAAVESSAEYIITSDRHLLKLHPYHGIKILKPSAFMREHSLQ
ncbi:MAG: putative toxin-antitoxin system toxin component, PIN family [Candidatus Altiarchaeales archaeon]|nr:putative toxin-antitoxin system toxin component, PIN family [Candidatus Altiarchaeales archaeon]